MKILFAFILISFFGTGQINYIELTDSLGNPVEHSISKSYSDYYFNNQPYSGQAIEYHENGTIWQVCNFSNGKRHGEFTVYSDKGTMLSKCYFSKNRQNGKYSSYYEGGEKFEEYNVENGIVIGEYRQYHKNGKLMTFGHFTPELFRGFRDGEWFEYDTDGKLVTTLTYKMGDIVKCVGQCE